jgi:hypothetical protein
MQLLRLSLLLDQLNQCCGSPRDSAVRVGIVSVASGVRRREFWFDGLVSADHGGQTKRVDCWRDSAGLQVAVNHRKHHLPLA